MRIELLLSALFFLLQYTAGTSFFYLGISSLASSFREDECTRVGLTDDQQIRLCRNNPFILRSIGSAVRRAIHECQRQFMWNRWNCSVNNDTVFGPIVDRATRETAFIYSITSASVVHYVTRACSAGNLTDCTCDTQYRGRIRKDGPKKTDKEKWRWGGCSDNIRYGMWFGQIFVDAPQKRAYELNPSARILVNKHNNGVGREVVKKSMWRKCRCHGISGSCTLKTCWMSLAPFHHVGAQLKRRYIHAVQIARRRSVKRLKRKDKRNRGKKINSTELVYIRRSPSYCRANPAKGILGTSGRPCNATLDDSYATLGSCQVMCCGRGYNKQTVKVVKRCNCRFIWCCKVKCEICEDEIELQYCN